VRLVAEVEDHLVAGGDLPAELGAHHAGDLELPGEDGQVGFEAPGGAHHRLDLGQDRRQECHPALADEGDGLR
jgi:hypothetical protein